MNFENILSSLPIHKLNQIAFKKLFTEGVESFVLYYSEEENEEGEKELLTQAFSINVVEMLNNQHAALEKLMKTNKALEEDLEALREGKEGAKNDSL